MKRLIKITTRRVINTDQEWESYKQVYDAHPDTHKIDWEKLESTGQFVDQEALPGEEVETHYELEEL